MTKITCGKKVLYDLYAKKNWSQQQIATYLGVTQSAVHLRMKKYGIHTRRAGMPKGFKFPSGVHAMEKNSRWRGGTKKKGERILIKTPGHPRADAQGYVTRGTLALEKIGVIVPRNIHIHHVNEDKTDDRPHNLKPFTNSEHRKLHCKTQHRDESGKFARKRGK